MKSTSMAVRISAVPAFPIQMRTYALESAGVVAGVPNAGCPDHKNNCITSLGNDGAWHLIFVTQ